MDSVKTEQKGYTLKELIKSSSQLIWFVLICILTVLLIPFVYQCYMFRQKAITEMPNGYKFPMLADFQLTIKSSLIFGITEALFKKHLPSMLSPFCKVQENIVERNLRCQKAASQLYRFFYYVTATATGYYVLKETDFLTTMLGGKDGSFLNCLKDYPYFKSSTLLNSYCLITMGYHLGSCYPLLYTAKKNDILEMSLHHLACLFCYFACYMINLPAAICVVNYIHDIADISISLARSLSESNFKNTCAVIFASNCFVWAYTRLYVLPQLVYVFFMEANEFAGPMLHPHFLLILVFLQSCLICLHAYWLKIFISILMSFVNKGVAEDTIQKTETQKVDQNTKK